MQSDLNVCEPTFSLRSRVLKGRDDAMMAEKWGLVRPVYFCVLYFAKKVYGRVATKGVFDRNLLISSLKMQLFLFLFLFEAIIS